MTKKIIIKNHIIPKVISQTNKNNYKYKFSKLRNTILDRLDIRKDTFHILSRNFKLNFSNKDITKFKKFKNISIVGMGGSILGSEAIYHFLKEKIKKKIYFFNDINSNFIKDLKNTVDFDKTLFIIISKSGSTTETLYNFVSLNIIKKNAKNIIIISEQNNNFLYKLSRKYNLYYIQHKHYIGGRYSVLSEVGVVPAFLMGLNINSLRKSIQKYLKTSQVNLIMENIVKLTLLIKQKKIKNLVLLNYSPRLEKFLYWLQQLIAESLGKRGLGLFPVISNAPKDHHSLLQLYLDGPKDKLFYIFYCEEKKDKKINLKKYFNLNSYLHNKTLSKIKESQKNALIKVFQKNKIPFTEFLIKEVNEEILGEFFSYFIIETAMTGKLLGINPFDQPAVEQVKIQTKKLLSKNSKKNF